MGKSNRDCAHVEPPKSVNVIEGRNASRIHEVEPANEHCSTSKNAPAERGGEMDPVKGKEPPTPSGTQDDLQVAHL